VSNTNNFDKSKGIASLFLLKAIGAIFVLLIHFKFPYKGVVEPIYRIGVPIFFVVGGYFFYSVDLSKVKERGKKTLRKMILLILFFNLIYGIVNHFILGKSIVFSFDFAKRLILYGDNIEGILWFLTSYFWTVVLIYFLIQINLKRIIFPLAVVLAVYNLLSGQYTNLVGLHLNHVAPQYYLPYLLVSYPFFIMGMWLRKHEKDKILRLTDKIVLRLFFISIICCYIEHRILVILGIYSGSTMMSAFFLTFTTMVLCIKHKDFGSHRSIAFLSTIGQEHSGNIYYWQFFVFNLFIHPFLLRYPIFDRTSALVMFLSLLFFSAIMNNLKKGTIQLLKTNQ
jgi:fucose 4-O-acetylase-like acetyltransferase